MNTFNNIKKCRLLKKMTQKQVSELLDINIRTYQKYESGDITPNIHTLNKIAKALMIDIDILFNWTDDIVICDDVIGFILKLYPDKYYSISDVISELKKVTNLNKTNPEMMVFLNGTSYDLDIYLAISKVLGLTEKQTYNWILTNDISQIIEYDYNSNPGKYQSLLRDIATNNLFEHQSLESLADGLSLSNEMLLSEYIHYYSKNEFIENTGPSKNNLKYNTNDIENNSKLFLNAILAYMKNDKHDILEHLTDNQINSIVKKVTDLVEYELYKIKKNN